MTNFIEIAKRQLTNLIDTELENLVKYPEDVVQETYLELIDYLETEEIEPSLIGLGAMYMQLLQSNWGDRLDEATRAPGIEIAEMHEHYPHTFYEIAPLNDRGVYAILCDLDTGAIIGPMSQTQTLVHLSLLNRKRND